MTDIHPLDTATSPANETTIRIDIWSDIACPWCYIGKRRLEAALEQFEHRDAVRIQWRSFQLDPGLPQRFNGTEGEYLQQRRGIPARQVRDMFVHTAAQARTVGLEYDFDTIVVANSLRAHQLLHLAREYGVTDGVKEALLSARFLTSGDIGDIAFLARVGADFGIPEERTLEVLGDERLLPAVRADIAEAHDRGIQGVPFFRFDTGAEIAGAQTVDVFLRTLELAWEAKQDLSDAEAGVCGRDGCFI